MGYLVSLVQGGGANVILQQGDHTNTTGDKKWKTHMGTDKSK